MVRERLTWTWLGTLVGLLLAIAVLTARFVWPPASLLYVGNVQDFAPGQPQRVNLAGGVQVYVVKLEDDLLVWDSMAPVSNGVRFVWVADNNRFEDPSSGAKWCADGTLADIRYTNAPTLTRYPVHIDEQGTIFISAENQIEGVQPTIDIDVPNSPTWMPPDDIYYCKHLPATASIHTRSK